MCEKCRKFKLKGSGVAILKILNGGNCRHYAKIIFYSRKGPSNVDHHHFFCLFHGGDKCRSLGLLHQALNNFPFGKCRAVKIIFDGLIPLSHFWSATSVKFLQKPFKLIQWFIMFFRKKRENFLQRDFQRKVRKLFDSLVSDSCQGLSRFVSYSSNPSAIFKLKNSFLCVSLSRVSLSPCQRLTLIWETSFDPVELNYVGNYLSANTAILLTFSHRLDVSEKNNNKKFYVLNFS